MSLLETVAIKVSSSIAKAILKRWLKDSPVTAAASSSLIDIIQSKTSDILAQRRGSRQFEEIGERVAISLLPLFEDESNHLDENGRIAVAMAVAETLDKSSIDSRVLVETNLDPSRLEKYLANSNTIITRDFSDPEIAFYKRIISEASQCIVDIASQLPSFTERTFAEVLSRENILLSVTNNILQEIQHLRENSRQANPEAEAVHFETEYRRAIIRSLDELELFGVDVSSASRRHRLSVAYVTLSVEQRGLKISEHRRKKGDESDRVILPADEALVEPRCLLIRGLAGSGKTTLLKWVAVRSASGSLEGRLGNWDFIPFFIQLRRHVDSELPRPEHFPGLVTPALADNMPRGWVYKQLQSGRAVVLVDGVDEAPEAQRPNVRKWLKDLVELYTQARFIVTSRPHAIGEGWMEREGFVDAELLPMELPDIETFIDHWHDAVGEELGVGAEITELASLRENLKKVVRRIRSIRELATNPLLCSMLCALHRDRHQRLPQDRIELYEACCHALIERRDPERGVKLLEYPKLNYRQKRALLQDFAYWLLSNGWSEVAIDHTDKRLELKLTNMRDLLQTITGTDARKLFVDRSGIIREVVPGRIDFIHRTFQEFLAAAAAVDEGNIGVLTKNAHDDQWWETISLAAGLAHKNTREELIKALIRRGDEERANRHKLHLLAVACLEASIELGTELAKEVQERLADLVPPKSMAEAKSLAAAGDLALPYLTPGRHKASVSAACVRTLALIGGEKALEVLAGYKRDLRRVVVNELLRAWDYFEPEPYARQILSSGTSLRLEPMSPYFLSAFGKLSHLTYLVTLDLSGCIQSSSIQPLADMPNLAEVDLSSWPEIRDLEVLASLPKLTRLNLAGCSWLKGLWSLRNLDKLSSLTLQGCLQLEDLEALNTLTSLTDLNLSNCPQIENLESLAGLTELKTLNLSGCSRIDDLRPLGSLTNLTTLDLSGNLWLIDLWALSQLKKLITLNIQGCSLLDEPLFLLYLRNLTTLNLQECSWVRDLKILEALPSLTTLNLSRCSQVKDLRPLAKLTNLATLDLSQCSRIEDLEPLTDLPKLTTLNLAGCTQVKNSNLMNSLPNLII